MKQEELIEKVDQYLETKKKIKEIKEMVVPPFVEKPIAVYAKDWNEYQKKRGEYDRAVYAKGEGLKAEEEKKKSLWNDIKEMLPQSNIWFVTDNNKYAVAHQSNDWPMDEGKLHIMENPVITELKEIRHQIIN